MTRLQVCMKTVSQSDLEARKRCKRAFQKMLQDPVYSKRVSFLKKFKAIPPLTDLFIWENTEERYLFWLKRYRENGGIV
jgi:hypothetical protein